MQPVFILGTSLFALGVMLSIAMGGSTSPQVRMEALKAETEAYFRNISSIVNNEITPSRLQAAGPADTPELFLTQPAIRQLAPGPWGNPLLDAWGHPLRVAMVREQRALNGQVTVPVTGVVLISAGPNRAFETEPGSPATLSALQGILPPLGSDDILAYFTDEDAQRNNLARLQRRVEAVAAALLRDYKNKFSAYVRDLQTQYQNALRQNPAALPPNIPSLLVADPTAPRFADLTDPTARGALGVSDHIDVIEQVWPDGGRFLLQTVSPDLRQSVTLRVINQAGAATPWATMNLEFLLQGGI